MKKNNRKKVIIIGGGLVGSACALFFARRGYNVEVFEKRNDIRTSPETRGRSINLALSHRGRKALRTLELEEEILKCSIPMKGRLLHNTSGKLKSVLYDPAFNQCIYSVGRNYLNKKLIEASEKYNNVKFYFNQLLIKSNFTTGSVTFINLITREEVEHTANLIIGADGAFSKLRLTMQQTPQFQYTQQYIEHGYLELCIPAENNNKMAQNRLHIWPRNEFMMIALPNQDGSWTVTLFMPFKKFEELKNPNEVLSFFKKTFPDAVELIGTDNILESVLNNKPSELISIKCSPYHIGSKFLIIGDAAHAMVPFYGQGMNAGFEDCSLLNELLDKNKDDIKTTIEEYTRLRVKNAHAICDLAMYNYVEMRDLVNRIGFQWRKHIDNFLFKYFPSKWVPLYNSVSFSSMEYAECVKNRKWQNSVIYSVLMTTGIIFGTLLFVLFKLNT